MPSAARRAHYAYPPPQSEAPPPLDWRHAEEPLPLVLRPDDRIDPRPPRRGSAALTLAVLTLVGIGGALALLDDRVRAPAPAEPAPVQKASMEQPLPQLPDRPLAAVQDPAGSVPREPAQAARPAPAQPSEPAPAEAAAAEGPPERLPPPPVDKADPWQVKAAAAGLHPELSRALLMRLSAEDYRNAEIAIRTALAETPNEAAYVYPTQRKADLALFRVHFVKGAPADCRRYVVTVTKDRWATTALPMEKCGLPAPRRRAS